MQEVDYRTQRGTTTSIPFFTSTTTCRILLMVGGDKASFTIVLGVERTSCEKFISICPLSVFHIVCEWQRSHFPVYLQE